MACAPKKQAQKTQKMDKKNRKLALQKAFQRLGG